MRRTSAGKTTSRGRRAQVRDRFELLKEKAVYILMSPVRLFKVVCFSVGFIVMMITFGVSIYLYTFFSSMPDIEAMGFSGAKDVADAKVRSRLHDKDRKYRWIDINDVSRDYLYTIVMSEDSHFFEHQGVNYDALINSFAENLKRRSYDFGASTISQQVVKNLFLSNEKTLMRKLKEILITRDLEHHLSKNQILELYFNVAEFGPDIFGVNAAAHYYFDKRPSKINAAEGAFIALMLPSPRRNHYAIYQNGNLTSSKKKKLKRVLKDMRYKEFITYKQYRHYLRYNYFRGSRRDPSGRLVR